MDSHSLPIDKVEKFLSSDSWNNIYFDYIHNSSNDEICQFISAIFYYYSPDLVNPIEIQKVIKFICSSYNNNFYHDWKHGSHVFLNSAYILSRVQNSSNDINENENKDSISTDFEEQSETKKVRLSVNSESKYNISNSPFRSLERFAYLYSALIHDAGHLGVSNSALIEKEHPLSFSYHNQSIAEMHSLSIGLDIFLKSDNLDSSDLLSKLTPQQKKEFRLIVIDVVLSTDIADPFKKLIPYQKLVKYSGDDGRLTLNSKDDSNSIENFQSRVSLLSVLIRCADIGSSFQNIETSIYWAKRFYMETTWAFYCGDGPRNENVSCYNSQILFLKFHAINLLEILGKTNCINRIFFNLMMNNVQTNKTTWEAKGNEYLNEWESCPEIQDMITKSN